MKFEHFESGITIYYEDERINSDTLALANFVQCTNSKQIIEVGCSNATILLLLSAKTKANLIGIEIQEQRCQHALLNIEKNNLSSRIKIINKDLNLILPNEVEQVDCIVCNPPYFKYDESKLVNEDEAILIERHEKYLTFSQIVQFAQKRLFTGGKFWFCHRVERMVELISILSSYNFSIDKIQFVHHRIDSNATLMLVCAVYNTNRETKILSPLIKENEYSK
jgi:tRNA1(Val) A37 N6-methylase TrmN6